MRRFVYVVSVALLSCGFVMAQTQDQQGTSPTPPGDRRDRYGDTIAPDGSDTPKGANTFPKGDNSQQSSQPSSMGKDTSGNSNTQGIGPTPPGDRRDRYGDTVAPDGSTTPKGANTPGSQPDNSQSPNMK